MLLLTFYWFLEQTNRLPESMKLPTHITSGTYACVLFFFLGISVLLGLNRLRKVEEKLEDHSGQSTSSALTLQYQTETGCCVRLGDLEFEFGPGAYEYYKKLSLPNQAIIDSKLRRRTIKIRWIKENLEELVDSSKVVVRQLDDFLKEAASLWGQITSEPSTASSHQNLGLDDIYKISRGILPSFVDTFRVKKNYEPEVTDWQGRVDAYLQSTRHDM